MLMVLCFVLELIEIRVGWEEEFNVWEEQAELFPGVMDIRERKGRKRCRYLNHSKQRRNMVR